MNTPQSFFRDLDSLLAKIIKEKNDKNNLTQILSYIENEFMGKLQIEANGLFEKRVSEFVLIYSSGLTTWRKQINDNSAVIKKVMDNGSFIYNDIEDRKQFLDLKEGTNSVPAVIFIDSPDERQWLMVFCLKNDWMREEIILFLNAVRTSINFRLFSDILGNEFQKAIQIQKSLLPDKAPKIAGYQIAGRSIPAELVGGDFFKYYKLDEGNFGIGIGDVSGHGLAAALSVRDVVIGLEMGLASEHKTVHIIKKLNKVLYKTKFENNFISFFIGEIENDGHLFYINAGHPSPFVVSNSEIVDLKASGIVLGFLENIDLHRLHFQLKPNSILVLYTDGVIERENDKEEHFDLHHLKNLVYENRHRRPSELVDLIFKSIYEFGNKTKWDDDATVVIIKRDGT